MPSHFVVLSCVRNRRTLLNLKIKLLLRYFSLIFNLHLEYITYNFQTIDHLHPKFVALHCQEVGGKNYEKSMQYVEDFVQLLINSNELRLFDKARIYLDEDYSSAENFTVK